MSELPRQLLAWLAKLLPQQKVVGDNAVQVGKVQGGLHMDRSTHSSAVHVTQVTHQHFYAVAATPSQAPAGSPAASNDCGRLTTPEQRDVFARMKQLQPRTYNKVVAFMRSEFNTGLVNQLNSHQLYRVRRYVEAIQRNEERNRA